MTKYYCYECKNGKGESNGPCVYTDPIGELHDANHITCGIGKAVWVRVRCKCCGAER